MSKTLKAARILVIVATTRPGRVGPAVADWFVRSTAATVDALGAEIDVADLAEIDLPFLNEASHPASGAYEHEHSRRWSERVRRADAVVFVTAEYNNGLPATLKNALDYLYAEWAWKPCVFVGYGNTSAGTRGVQMARQVATTLRMVPVGADIFLRIGETLRDTGVVDNEQLNDNAVHAVRELHNLAARLWPLYDRDDQYEAVAAI